MNSSSPRRTVGNRSKIGGITVLALVAIYSVAVPHVNDRFGWNLPSITADADGNVQIVDTQVVDLEENRSSSELATARDGEKSTARDSADDLLYGLLREVSSKRYLSPAGLLYTPGSAEGHRLEHLRRHTKDDPSRPGSHGVFDGEMEGALKTIDRAYQRAKKGQKTTKKEDRGRTIYTVDMGGRVGFVGGRDGNRKQKPMARRVRIVLEENRFITAYPL